MSNPRSPLVAVCGTSTSNDREFQLAESIGALCAACGWTVLCGGLGGVMTAAAKGATEAGGVAIGFLPGDDPGDGNAYLTYSVPTGLGEMRNGLLTRASAGMIAVGGGYGTLSEIGFALRTGKPLTCLESWKVQQPHETRDEEAIHWASDPNDAVEWLASQIRYTK